MNEHVKNNPPVAHFILAAVLSEFWNKSDWQAWADRIITRIESPPIWIINLSVASDAQGVMAALNEKLLSEDMVNGRRVYIGDSRIGYQFLRYLRGDFSLSKILSVIGQEADGGTSSLSCEKFFELLNMLDAGMKADKVETEMRRLISKNIAIVENELVYLKDYLGPAE